MNEEYYLLEGDEKSGPYTLNQLLQMKLDIHTEVITPQSDSAQYASNLPEFIDYFERKGIYFPTGDNLAPFGSRIFAFIIDYFLVSMIILFILIKLGWIMLPTQPVMLPNAQMALLAQVFYPVFFVYNILFEISKLKATPGKMLCKIMVVDIDGQSLKLGNAIIKSLGVCLSLVIYALPFFSALFNEHRQAWYERIAKSYQITKNQG
ncbi:MAG: RDD family protein [Bacteroidota bacterium]